MMIFGNSNSGRISNFYFKIEIDHSIDRCLLKDSLWPSGKHAGPGVREGEFNPSFVNTKCCELEQVT